MKILYWLSYALSFPFYSISWFLYGVSWLLCYAGNVLHDKTTYKLWLILHARECAALAKNPQ